MNSTKVEIRTKSILMFFGILIGLYLLIALRNIIVLFIFAYILYCGFRPTVDKLESFKIPRWLSISIIYLLLFSFITILLIFTIDTLIKQIEFFATEFPTVAKSLVERINDRFPDTKQILDSNRIGEDLKDYLKQYTNISDLTSGSLLTIILEGFNALRIGSASIVNSVLGGFLSVFTVFITSIYMLNRKEIFFSDMVELFPKKYQKNLSRIILKIQNGLSEWLRGELILMFVIGIFSYILIMIPYLLGIDSYDLYKFAVIIALLAGLFEAFPNIGPTITLIVATILAIGTGASIGIILYIFISFIALQQLEGFLLVPHVMKRVVKIDPVLAILAIIGGVQLGGVLGAVLSIPTLAVLRIVVLELSDTWKNKNRNYA